LREEGRRQKEVERWESAPINGGRAKERRTLTLSDRVEESGVDPNDHRRMAGSRKVQVQFERGASEAELKVWVEGIDEQD
jgi:hypothetical protein